MSHDDHKKRCEAMVRISDRLRRDADQLAKDAEVSVEVYRTSGEILTSELASRIEQLNRDFVDLRGQVVELAGSLGQQDLLDDQERSFTALAALLERCCKSASAIDGRPEQRAAALDVLHRVLELTHAERPDFAPLSACQDAARRLMGDIENFDGSDHHPEEDELVAGVHPLACLLALVEHDTATTDEDIERLHIAVQEVLSGAVALAAARGKLIRRKPVELGTEPKEESVTAPGAPLGKDRPLPEELGDQADGNTPDRADNGATAGDKSVTELTSPVQGPPDHGRQVDQAPPVAAEATTGIVTEDHPVILRVDQIRPERPSHSRREEPNEPHGPIIFVPETPRVATQSPKDISASPDRLRDMVWRLLSENRAIPAYWVARAAELSLQVDGGVVPSRSIEAMVIGPYLRLQNGEVARALKRAFAEFEDDWFNHHDEDWNQGLRFLLASSSSRAALLAPETGASTVLRGLKFQGVEATYQYCKALADYGDRQLPLEPTMLKRIRELGGWESDIQALRSEYEAWHTANLKATLMFTGATKVWRSWISPNGVIHRMLEPVRSGDNRSLGEALSLAARFSDDVAVRYEIRKMDKILRTSGDDIIARPLAQLRGKVREAVTFLQRWSTLQQAKPDRPKDYLQKNADALSAHLTPLQSEVLTELTTQAESTSSVAIRTGIAAFRRAVVDIAALFDPDQPFESAEPDLPQLLGGWLLKVPELAIDSRFGVSDSDLAASFSRVTELATGPEPSWIDALAARSKERNYLAVGLILDILDDEGRADTDVPDIRAKSELELRECRDALRRDVLCTERVVENAVAFGVLAEHHRASLTARIERVRRTLDVALRFAPEHAALLDVCEEVKRRQIQRCQEARLLLERDRVEPTHPAYSRIEACLTRGDVLTTHEYLDYVRRGQSLPEATLSRDAFSEWFPARVHEIAESLEKPNAVSTLQAAVRDRKIFGGLDFGTDGVDAEKAGFLLRAWFETSATKRIDRAGVKSIFHELGFRVTGVGAANRTRGASWFEVTTEPIKDREQCPVPEFGSVAAGKYLVLPIFNRPNEEDLVNLVGNTQQGPPVIVLHFGRIPEQRRRDLARLSRERRRSFVVVDDILAVFLAAERGARLPVLFACALPFSTAAPFSTTAGFVAPEMFYGRERELQSVVSPAGASFLYGGRQLGKTALLRQVVRNFHDPECGHLAILIDLKGEGLGLDRRPDDVWSVLAEEFKRQRVLGSNYALHFGPDRFADGVRQWLAVHSDRRILLLLDEADRFLLNDEKDEFSRTERLKGLMDSTERRFKLRRSPKLTPLRSRGITHPILRHVA